MRTTMRLQRIVFPALLLLCWWSASSTHMLAQVPGNNAVYTSATNVAPSSSYIDASAFNVSSDICSRIHAALGAITGGAAVIDARGISTSLTCPVGKTPWVYTTTTTTPATILLPAGTILLNTGWVLPTGTRIIGEGGGANSSSATAGITTIRACTSTTSTCSQNLGGPLISMGSSSFCPLNSSSVPVCTGISIENVWLDGQGQGNTAIANTYAQEQSYVKHVTLYEFAATGLNVTLPSSGSGTSQNSGPYSDITCIVGTNAASGTTCVRIQNVSTRGVHGLTCTNSSATIPTNAIALDGPNNSIEDVTVQGFQYGVRVGAGASAPSNILRNITGGTNVTAVVFLTSVAGHAVNDIVVLGVGNGGAATDTILDNRTTPATTITDAAVAMYVLGESITSGGTSIGYTRFTTSTSVPTWIHGNSTPTGSCQLGSLYSNTAGVSGSTWYVCTEPVSSTLWSVVK